LEILAKGEGGTSILAATIIGENIDKIKTSWG